MARWHSKVPYLRSRRCCVSEESAQVAVQEHSWPSPVLGKSRNHLRGLSDPTGKVVRSRVDAVELQERSKQLRTGPHYRRDSKVGMVHAAPRSRRNAIERGNFWKAWW